MGETCSKSRKQDMQEIMLEGRHRKPIDGQNLAAGKSSIPTWDCMYLFVFRLAPCRFELASLFPLSPFCLVSRPSVLEIGVKLHRLNKTLEDELLR